MFFSLQKAKKSSVQWTSDNRIPHHGLQVNILDAHIHFISKAEIKIFKRKREQLPAVT